MAQLRSVRWFRPQATVAVSWDNEEIRYVLAVMKGDGLQILGLGSRQQQVSEGDSPDRQTEAVRWLREAIRRARVSRVDAMVAIGRSDIELMHLQLPPAADEELPELVHNQAMRESHIVTEDVLIDFVADGDPSCRRSVTAVALTPDRLESIRSLCSHAGMVPKRIVLRPYATASVVVQSVQVDAEGTARLIVNRVAGEADLILLDDDRVAFWRTVRLPQTGESGDATNALLAEIRRTLVVGVSREDDQAVSKVYVVGADAASQVLADAIRDRLEIATEVVNPLDGYDIPGDVEIDDAGSYAPLLGMLKDEMQGRDPAIDLLHPRRKPKPPDRRRLIGIAAALGIAITSAVGYVTWDEFDRLKQREQQLSERVQELEELVQQAGKQQEVVESIRQWKQGDVVLLDELRDLSLRLPNARDMVVMRFSSSIARTAQTVINIQGLVRDPLVVYRMERNLRDEFHEVVNPRGRGQGEDEDYTWRFESTITVEQRDKGDYLRFLPVGRREPSNPARQPPLQFAQQAYPPARLERSRGEARP